MARSKVRVLSVAVALVASSAACTFTGLGDYDVETCARPKGSASTVQKVGALNDLTFSSASGKNVIGAFTADVTGGTCIEAVGSAGFLNANCLFLSSETNLVPKQPFVVPLSGGFSAALITTTAPCTSGVVSYRFSAPGVYGSAGAPATPCPATGAALPAVAPLSDAATAVVAWYETPYASRQDAIASCSNTQPAPLDVTIVTNATSGTPVWGTSVQLTTTSTAVRPPAIVAIAGQQAILAAPLSNDVGVWTLSASAPPSQPVTIPSLAGARAVAIALAGDGSGRIGIAAEIGCSPQSIAFAVGTLAGGFAVTNVVAPSNGDLAVAPSVAWIDGSNRWVVAWISATGGAHVLTRSYDASGNPLGLALDPGMSATAAVVSSAADVFGFVASTSSFVDTSLGCTP